MIEIARRPVGGTSLRISEIGFGTGHLGGISKRVPDAQGQTAIKAALDAGIRYLDTAPFYGYGRSEHLVGQVVRETDAEIVLSTKVGRLLVPYDGTETTRGGWVQPLQFEPRYDYSYDGIMRSVEDSYQRLGMSKIDLLYVHDIGTFTHGVEANARYWRQLTEGGYRALAELKASGRVKAIGIGANEWQVLADALEIGDWDVFLLAQRYTLLEQGSLPLLKACHDRKTSIVVGGVFNGGVLMGGDITNYAGTPDAIVTRLRKLADFCRERQVPIGAAAVQMPLANATVCSVLCGGISPDEVVQFLSLYRTKIPAQFWSNLAVSGLLTEGTPLPGDLVAA